MRESHRIWGWDFMCSEHSTEDRLSLHHPISPDCSSVLIPCSHNHNVHVTSLSPKENSPGCFLLVPRPSGCPLPLGWWKQELLHVPKKYKRAVLQRSISLSSEPRPAGWLSARNPNTGQGCTGCNKPFRAAKQVRDLKEYISASIMINRMVAKVPEALAGSVCVHAHMCIRQWESLSVPRPENPLQGQSFSPSRLFTQPILWPSVPDFLCIGREFPTVTFKTKSRKKHDGSGWVSISLTSVMDKYARPDSSLWLMDINLKLETTGVFLTFRPPDWE